MTQAERDYQPKLKSKIEKLLPGCTILKNDPRHFQGIADLTILYCKLWALLEIKISKKANHRPNQDYYVDKYNKQGFASIIYPEIEDEVLDRMVKYLRCQNDLE